MVRFHGVIPPREGLREVDADSLQGRCDVGRTKIGGTPLKRDKSRSRRNMANLGLKQREAS